MLLAFAVFRTKKQRDKDLTLPDRLVKYIPEIARFITASSNAVLIPEHSVIYPEIRLILCLNNWVLEVILVKAPKNFSGYLTTIPRNKSRQVGERKLTPGHFLGLF